jgi:hypothetical protein
MQFPATAGDGFTFDTPTFSVYGQLASWLGHPNASTIFAGVPFVGGIVLALLPLRRRIVPAAIGVATIVVLLLSGIPAYAGDHAMTRGTLSLRAGDPPDWLDRSRIGPTNYLQLPGGFAHYGWLLETWNHSFRMPIHMALPTYDGYASDAGSVDRNGRFLVNGRPPAAGVLVVNDFGTAIDIEGRVFAHPVDGLTAYRLPARPHVRSLATGLFFDDWAAAFVRFQAWPQNHSGHAFYRAVLTLPRGLNARKVTFELDGGSPIRSVWVGPGERKVAEIPVSGFPVPILRIRTDRADYVGAGTPNARSVAIRIPALSYVAKSR